MPRRLIHLVDSAVCVFLCGRPSGRLSVREHPAEGQTMNHPAASAAAVMAPAWSQSWLTACDKGPGSFPRKWIGYFPIIIQLRNSILKTSVVCTVLCAGRPGLPSLLASISLLFSWKVLLVGKISDLVTLDAAILLDFDPYMQAEWHNFVTF